MSQDAKHWAEARLALALLAIDPGGLGGLWLTARSGPVRDRYIAALGPVFAPRAIKRLHPGISDDQLYGALDFSATLETGRSVFQDGLLSGAPSLLLLGSGERCEPALAARLAGALDHKGHVLAVLDESTDETEPAELLSDRLAFHLVLDGLSHRHCPEIVLDTDALERARLALPRVVVPEPLYEQVTQLALQFGVISLRAVRFVIAAARALAAWEGDLSVTTAHLETALLLIIAPRATALPEPDAPLPETAQESQPPGEEAGTTATAAEFDRLVEAVQARLPPDVLERLQTPGQARISGNGSGAASRGNRRGRPKPPRRGRLGGDRRLDLVATLRAAAPWQKLRRTDGRDRPVELRASDLRLKNFEEKSDRLLIFAVDASGSAALARLAEAKGAVELLLAEAYARRDHVALVAFRGTEADVLLPPTRSLVQTKRRLAALPGGGGTPLASGLQAAFKLSEATRAKGMTPTIALLSDGQANIGLDGQPGRITATEDARAMARLIAGRDTPALVIDTAVRPRKALAELAGDLAATYLPLPRADAHKVCQAIEAVLD